MTRLLRCPLCCQQLEVTSESECTAHMAKCRIFHAEYGGSGPTDCPIRLSYHDGEHYNAVVDPLLPTAGLGLGLPGLEPGLADRMQLERAKEMSDRSYLDLAVRESRTEHSLMYEKRAYALSDLDAADFDLEQAVLEQSLRSYRSEQGRKKPPRPGRRDRDWDDIRSCIA